MATQAPQRPIQPSPLVVKTARAIYVASKHRCTGFLAYEDLDRREREDCERMAVAALDVVLREPVTA